MNGRCGSEENQYVPRTHKQLRDPQGNTGYLHLTHIHTLSLVPNPSALKSGSVARSLSHPACASCQGSSQRVIFPSPGKPAAGAFPDAVSQPSELVNMETAEDADKELVRSVFPGPCLPFAGINEASVISIKELSRFIL